MVARYLSFIHPPLQAWSSTAVLIVNTIRLFIIEKNSKVRQALQARLSSSSHIEVVGTARGAAEGIRSYAELEPDVILLDAKTAGRPKHVADVVSDLTKHGSNVIVLTSYSFDAEREAAMDSGAAQYLLKDIDSEALIRAIEALGNPSAQKAT